jgi:hypothetical protein
MNAVADSTARYEGASRRPATPELADNDDANLAQPPKEFQAVLEALSLARDRPHASVEVRQSRKPATLISCRYLRTSGTGVPRAAGLAKKYQRP